MAGASDNWYISNMKLACCLAALCWAASVSADPVSSAIAQLAAPKFADRRAAVAALVKLAEADPKALLQSCAQAYRQANDPEVRWRLREAMEQVVEQHLFRAPRGFLGVQINNVFVGGGGRLVINGLDVPPGGVWISSVVDGSGAAKAGLQANDVIVAVNGRHWPGEGSAGFIQHIQSHAPGTKLNLTVLRANQTNEFAATLADLPEAQRENLYSDQRAREFFANWWQQNVGTKLPTE